MAPSFSIDPERLAKIANITKLVAEMVARYRIDPKLAAKVQQAVYDRPLFWESRPAINRSRPAG